MLFSEFKGFGQNGEKKREKKKAESKEILVDPVVLQEKTKKEKKVGPDLLLMLETVHPNAKSSFSQCTVHRYHLISNHVPQVHQWEARVVVII